MRNFSIANGCAVAPDPHLAEEHRAARVELDRQGDAEQERRQGDEPEPRADRVEAALDDLRGARQAEAAHAEQRDPVDVVDLDRRADDLEDARQQAHAHAGRLRLADEVQRRLRQRLAGLDDHAVHAALVDEPVQRWRAVVGELGAGEPLERHAPDELRPTVAVGELRAQALEGLAAADEQAALGGGHAARDEPRDPAGEQRGDEQRAPEAEDLIGAEVALDEPVLQQHDEQGVERRALKELRRLVDRRLVEDELVAVVEAVRLAGDDDERQGEQGLDVQAVVPEDVQAHEAGRAPAARTSATARPRRKIASRSRT